MVFSAFNNAAPSCMMRNAVVSSTLPSAIKYFFKSSKFGCPLRPLKTSATVSLCLGGNLTPKRECAIIELLRSVIGASACCCSRINMGHDAACAKGRTHTLLHDRVLTKDDNNLMREKIQ